MASHKQADCGTVIKSANLKKNKKEKQYNGGRQKGKTENRELMHEKIHFFFFEVDLLKA